jgi:DMSO/TMAO reductase YedYZ molybdopterin-dependent catalytic subunit
MAATAGVSVVDPGPVLTRLIAGQSAQGCGAGHALGRLVGTLPLSRPDGVVQPYGIKIGRPGLDARLNTDLSTLEPDRLITPTDQIYVRTECPPAVAAHQGRWTIRTSGLLAKPSTVALDDIIGRARPMGAHLLECSGNNNPANFGLMSVAEWDGVPLLEVVDTLRPSPQAAAVLVSGVDPDQPSATSIPGAGWVFPLSTLASLGAFLAVRMNGEPLPLDHGKPVRLAVPGWYGCSWIKWVDEIRLVDASEPATSQMREFAGRTHQTAVHALAAVYTTPAIQTAATPIRVEKRQGPAGLEYRVVGIVWGGVRPVNRLAIQFNPGQPWQTFDVCPAPLSSRAWSLWSYRWRPSAPGVYSIALRVPDASVPQRRLDSGYYVRQVSVDEM